MLYVILGHDVHNSLERRLAARPAHLARLAALEQEQRLELAGPFPLESDQSGAPSFSGSLIIADFPSVEAARTWADADPYVSAGVYARVDIFPFKKVLPSR
ncbi:MAG: YciI family protein [Rhodocyclaceae bacterium]|nr:YciI family protein [Rhodocyclaceae bacterium]